ncbi:hypothetical protein DF186_25665, partial [Enterococcus hirae]
MAVNKTIEEFGYDPLKFSYGSGKRSWFKCSKCNREFFCTIYDRVQDKGCLICSEKNRLENYKKAVLKRSKTLSET